MGIGDLEIVPEDFVVADFQRGDSGPFPLALLQRGDVLLASVAQGTAFVERSIKSGTDYSTVAQQGRGTLDEPCRQLGREVREEIELLEKVGQ